MREETRRILLKINGQIHFGLAREGPVVAVSVDLPSNLSVS